LVCERASPLTFLMFFYLLSPVFSLFEVWLYCSSLVFSLGFFSSPPFLEILLALPYPFEFFWSLVLFLQHPPSLNEHFPPLLDKHPPHYVFDPFVFFLLLLVPRLAVLLQCWSLTGPPMGGANCFPLYIDIPFPPFFLPDRECGFYGVASPFPRGLVIGPPSSFPFENSLSPVDASPGFPPSFPQGLPLRPVVLLLLCRRCGIPGVVTPHLSWVFGLT